MNYLNKLLISFVLVIKWKISLGSPHLHITSTLHIYIYIVKFTFTIHGFIIGVQ